MPATTNHVHDALLAITDAKLIADMLLADGIGDADPRTLLSALADHLQTASAALGGR